MINNLPSLQPDLFPPSENPQEDPRRLCILGLSEFLMLKKFINGEKSERDQKENRNIIFDLIESVSVTRKPGPGAGELLYFSLLDSYNQVFLYVTENNRFRL